MNARLLLAAAVIAAAAAAAAWLLLGPGIGTATRGAQDAVDDMDSGGAADGAARPGLAAAKPGSTAEERRRTGRCEIEGIVRREGKPTAASIELRRVRDHDEVEPPTIVHLLLSSPSRRWPVVARGTAGADGRFRLRGIATGDFQVVATAEDGAKGAVRVSLEADGVRAEANPVIRWGQESLRGRVLHADGRPWSGGVAVTQGTRDDGLDGISPVGDPTPTDAEGRFTVAGLEPGRVTVSAIVENDLRMTDDSVRLPFAGEYVMVIDANAVDVTGRVVDATDGSPLPNAKVTVSAEASANARLLRLVVTDLGGRYRASVPPGKGSVAAEAEGFAGGRSEYSDPKEEVEVRLSKSASVKGRVTSASDGRPVEGVTVHCGGVRGGFFDVEGLGAKTDSDGRYSISKVPPGDHAIVAVGAGWISSGFVAKDTGSKNPFAVTLVAGKETVVDLTVVPGAKITGVVLDSTGKPVEGASVGGSAGGLSAILVFARRDFSPVMYAQRAGPTASAADGTFTLDSLLPDTEYRLEAKAPGAASGRAGPVTPTIDVTPRVEIRLPAPRWVEVTVVEEAGGAPVPGASVSVKPRPKKEPGSEDLFSSMFDSFGWISNVDEATDAKGVARVGPLPEGPLEVSASAVGFVAEDEGRLVDGSEGSASELSMTIRLNRGLEIAGHVVMPDGKPAVGANVSTSTGVRRSRGSMTRFDGSSSRGETDAAGAFRLTGLSDGTYEVTASLSHEGEYRASASADAGKTDVVLTLTADAGPQRILLTVLDGDGKPVKAARAEFTSKGFRTSSRVQAGRAEISVERRGSSAEVGEGTVEISEATGSDGKPAPWGGARLEGVKPGGTYEIRLPPEAAIAGHVVGPDGRGVEGVTVDTSRAGDEAASPSSARRNFRGVFGVLDDTIRTDTDGTFRIGRLGAGDYWISVDPPPAYIKPDPVRATAGSLNVKIELHAGIAAAITVLDAAGAPVAGAHVTASADEDAVEHLGSSLPDEFFELITGGPPATGKDGMTRIPNLDPAVRYTLTVRGPRTRNDLANFLKKDWAPTDTTVRLASGFTITGFVRDTAGVPIAKADVTAKASDGHESRAESGADGAFRFAMLPAGNVDLSTSVRAVVGEAGTEAATSVAAGANGVVLTVDTGLDLVVHIEDWAADDPYESATLSEEGQRHGKRGRETVDSGRVVKFRGLRAGATYMLWLPADATGRSVYATGLKAGEVHLKGALGKTITGRVTFPPHATDKYLWASGDGIGIGNIDPSLKPDDSYEVHGLPTGTTWRVTAYATVGTTRWEAEGEVAAGGTLDLVLKPQAPEPTDGK